MDAKISVEVGAKIDELQSKLRKAGDSVKSFATGTDKSLGSVKTSFASVGSFVAGLGLAATITDLTKQVFSATAEFQKFSAVLSNTLGSDSLAKSALKDIQEFAAKTPFGVSEVTAAFVKLANSGFKPTNEQLTKLGDLAASTGKSFDQLAEAILDAQTGEFERLKEFGIRAKDAGDQVIFTYKGVQTEVEKTSSSIREYITSLGEAEGTYGSMAKISETLGGKLSNLRDNWDQLLISVGQNTEGVFSGAISVIGEAIKKITEFNKEAALADKFNLKQDFGLNFQQGKLKLSDVSGQVAQVENARQSVEKYVKSIKEIAKTPQEFESATKSLANIAREQTKGLGNINLTKAIVTQYTDGIKLLKALGVEAGKIKKVDANFGKGGKSEESGKLKEQLKDAEATLRDSLINARNIVSQNNADVLKGFGDNLKRSYDKETKQFKDSIQTDKPLIDLPAIVGATGLSFDTAFDKMLARAAEFNKQISEVLTYGVIDGIGGIASAIGESLAAGTNVLQAVGGSLLSSFGDIMIQLGKIAIGTAIGIEAIKTALKTLNPVVAVAAGVALIALGSFVKGKVSALGGGQSGTSSGTRKIPGFASGVQNFNGGLALVGERGPELVNLPKGSDVIPNGQLGGLMGNGGSQVFIADTILDGNSIRIVYNRATALASRNGS